MHILNLISIAALLVHVSLSSPKVETDELRQLRETAHDLERKSELSEAVGDQLQAEQLHRLAQQREQDVMRLLANR